MRRAEGLPLEREQKIFFLEKSEIFLLAKEQKDFLEKSRRFFSDKSFLVDDQIIIVFA